MSVRHFKGFPSLQEIACTAGNLRTEAKVLSLKMFTLPGNIILASANPVMKECVTFREYSSCSVTGSDTRKSELRVLVSDMDVGEVRRFGCRVNSFDSVGDTISTTWSITVERRREYFWNLLEMTSGWFSYAFFICLFDWWVSWVYVWLVVWLRSLFRQFISYALRSLFMQFIAWASCCVFVSLLALS